MKPFPITLLLLLVAARVDAADVPAAKPSQPDTTVSTQDASTDGARSTGAAKNDPDAAKPTPSKTPPIDAKSGETKNGDFKPSEEISEDMAVAYPVDI